MNNTDNTMDMDLTKTSAAKTESPGAESPAEPASVVPFRGKNASQENGPRRGRRPSVFKVRKALNLTQVELAKKLRVTQAMVSMIESGKAKPGRMLATRIDKLRQKSA